MAKLYFNYSAMNAGKSTILLQAAHNYEERGMQAVLFTAALDDRYGVGNITSRIGLSKRAHMFDDSTDLFAFINDRLDNGTIDCVLVDEAQFLTEKQVWQLAHAADKLDVPVICYGLRTDFQGKLFPGSAALLALAEDVREVRTVCWCGRKATMNLRIAADGQVASEGEQVEIGGEDKYISVCRKHWSTKKVMATRRPEGAQKSLPLTEPA